jgi:Putative Ig domain
MHWRRFFRWSRSPLIAAATVALVLVTTSSVVFATARSASAATTSADSTNSTSPYPATGYFTVTQKAGGGWTLVTPQGQPFYASGIDTVSPDGSGTDASTGTCPYCTTVSNDFPSTAAWATSTISQIRSWGFNSLGGYSDDADLGSQMPYEVQLSMASGDDWFAPSFVTNADQVAATQVAPLANDPNVIGYFTDSELNWGPLLSGDNPATFDDTVLQEYLQLPSGSPGLAVAQEYEGDPSGFLFALATRYFSVTSAAVRMYDPNHLILGVKAEGQEIEPAVLQAAEPYINVFSVEDYVLLPGFDQVISTIWPAYLAVQQNLANLEAVANMPLMIGEYSFTSPDNTSNDPDTDPLIYLTASSQQQRASQYEDFIAPLYEDTPALVGDEWFQYVDEPPGGRTGDGENSDFGMIDVNGNPYPTMVAATTLMHNVIADETGDSGTVCDSWATGTNGVVCTANMPPSPTPPLTIVTTTLPTGTVGAAYGSSYAASNNLSAGVFAAGGTPGYSYAVTQGSLPAGLTIDPTNGDISGFPSAAGATSFTVQASDSGGSQPVSQAFSITINSQVKLSLSATTLSATQGQYFQDVLGANGGAAPYTWALTQGTLPAGLTLTSYGDITGEATASGTFAFTVKATDASSPAQTATAQITVKIPPTTSVLLPSAGATLQGTTLLDAAASSQSGISTVQFEISGGSLTDKAIGSGVATPYGYLLYVNSSSVPNGTYTIQSVATDQQGRSTTSAPVAVTISNPPVASVLIPSPGATLSGSTYFDASASNATNVQFLLFGGSFGFAAPVICTAGLTLFGWLCAWTSGTVPNASYFLVAEASGPTGSAYSSGVAVTVNN